MTKAAGNEAGRRGWPRVDQTLSGLAVLVAALIVAAAGGIFSPRSAWAEPEGDPQIGVTGSKQEKPAQADAPSGEVPPDVGLDRLLQLPSSMSFEQQKRNGVSADEWRRRFRESLHELAEATAELSHTRDELDELAGGGAGGSQWQVAPPGSNQTEVSPMSFKLREEMRSGKQRLEEAEQRHRALIIEADLAGVPESWRADSRGGPATREPGQPRVAP